ncbi:hypothetical protein GCM10028803_04190 [Larkinella knui]|uniref:Lipoprotein n=1 Tax=Larkinella knui TaxID=2025310 RepID=A0A3P1CKQ7_9BACT|nr:hypothetical protein [Larkinella knui]RRB13897.1 hypothetical protein EHT87_16720 [Larkinella knui]
MRLSALPILGAALLLSCQQKDITKPDCGCDGKAFQVLNNVKASYTGKRFFMYRDPQNDKSVKGLQLCESTLMDPNWQADSTKFNFTISGQIKSVCTPLGIETLIIQIPLFVPTQIVKE